MNIEGLKKRKELIENNLKQLKEKITIDTQNMFRIEGALLDVNELIADEEKKIKEANKDGEKVDSKGDKAQGSIAKTIKGEKG